MALWLDIIKTGLPEIKQIITGQKEKRAKVYEAVEAIHKAAIATNIFLQECMRKVEKPNKDLSEIWMEAASKVRELDNEFYIRLLGKADYWSFPASWSDEQLQHANISLEAIKKDALKILEHQNSK